MSNNYTDTAIAVRMSKEAAEFAICLNECIREMCDTGDEPGVGDLEIHLLASLIAENQCDSSSGCEFEWREEEGVLYVYSEGGSTGEMTLAMILQETLRRFTPEGVITFQVAYHGYKHRPDAFGGAAYVVTAKEIHSTGTADWIGWKLQELGLQAESEPQKFASVVWTRPDNFPA